MSDVLLLQSVEMGGSQLSKPEELRIVLIGKTGAGKTSTMNTFLGIPAVLKNQLASDGRPCTMETAEFEGQKLVLADTFGLCHTSKSKEEVLSQIIKSTIQAFESHQGPHVFLYVHKWENDFTAHDEERVEVLKRIFGEESRHYFLLLITHVDGELSDWDKNKIRNFMIKVSFETQGYCVINNTGEQAQKTKQKQELVNRINQMAGTKQFYTQKMFGEAQEALKRKIPASQSQRQTGAADQHVTSVLKAMLSPVLPADAVTLVILGNTWLAKKFDRCLSR